MKGIRKGVQLGLYAALVTCSACSDQTAPPTTDEMGHARDVHSGEQDPQPHVTSIGESLTQQVSAAVAELAARLGVDATDVTVDQARSVSWSSSALGCPKEGMAYTQQIVPGMLVILKYEDVLYQYHGRAGAVLRYCPAELAKEPAYGAGQEFM